MASPARDARIAAAARGFSEIVERGRGHLKTRNPSTGAFAIDAQVGDVGWHYGAGLEVDTAWETSADPAFQLQMVEAEYNAYARNVFNAGDLIKYVHPASGEWVIFDPQSISWYNQDYSQQQIAIKQAVSAVTVDDKITYPDAYGAGRHWRFFTDTARLQKLLTIDNPLPAPTVQGTVHFVAEFSLKMSAGLSFWLDGVLWPKTNAVRVKTGNHIECKDSQGNVLFWLKAPTAEDASDSEITGEYEVRRQGGPSSLFITVRIPYTWLETATYPVEIDPTVDVQVGASADDAYEVNSNIDLTAAANILSSTHATNRYYCIFVYPNVTIPNGATITQAYPSFYFYNASVDSPDTVVYMEDNASPATPTTATNNISARSRTTASYTYQRTNLTTGQFDDLPTDSMVAAVQELVDSYDYSSGAPIAVITYEPTSGDAGSCRTYDNSSSLAAKFHIEYTTGGGGTTYEDALSLSKSISILDSSVGSFLHYLLLEKNVSTSFINAIDFDSAFSLSKNLGISVNTVIAIETIVSMAKQLDILFDSTSIKETIINFSKQINISSDTVLELNTLLAINNTLGFSTLSALEIYEIISLSKELSTTFVGGLDLQTSINFSKLLTILLNSDTSTEVALELVKQLNFSSDSVLTAECILSLNKSLDISLLSNVELYEIISLSKELFLSVEGGRDLESVLTLSRILSILTSSEVVINVYESAITFTKELGISSTITLDREGNISLNKALDFTTTNQADLVDTINLIKSVSMINSGNIDFLVQVGLEKTIALTISGGLNLEESIILGEELNILLTSLITKEAYLSLNKELALQNVGLLDAAGQIILAKDLDIDLTTQVEFNTSISLDKNLLVSLIGGLNLEDAITLGYNLAIVTQSTLIPVVVTRFGTVTINDVKYVMVIIGDE